MKKLLAILSVVLFANQASADTVFMSQTDEQALRMIANGKIVQRQVDAKDMCNVYTRMHVIFNDGLYDCYTEVRTEDRCDKYKLGKQYRSAFCKLVWQDILVKKGD